jgi:hypothetical protein
MHHYAVKFAIVLLVVAGINRLLRVSLFFPVRLDRIPVRLLLFINFFEVYGWTVIPALIVAGVWQIAEQH